MVEDEHLTFELFGIYNGVFAMKDHQTESVWSHIEGLALRGPLAGTRMEMVPLVHATWEEWRKLHPDTSVLSENTPWRHFYRDRNIGGPGLNSNFVRSLVHVDLRLPAETLVLAVGVDGTHAAYPLSVLGAHDRVVNDDLAGEPIVAWYAPGATSASAYSRVVDGVTLEFGSPADGVFHDKTTGSGWNLQGLATSGPLEGAQLRYVPSFISEWYGWVAHHPDTTIYDYDLAKTLATQEREQRVQRRRR